MNVLQEDDFGAEQQTNSGGVFFLDEITIIWLLAGN